MTTEHCQTTARLALEDGTVFHGRAFGAVDPARSVEGEVVFNTAMCGYQEAITDPSYAGQILCMTAPMIGNYGSNDEDGESPGPQIAGFVIRERSRIESNFRSTQPLDDWLRSAGIIGLEGIDTRALVRLLRSRGAMRGVISTLPAAEQGGVDDAALIDQARHSPEMAGRNLALNVSPAESFDWQDDLGEWRRSGGDRHRSTPFRVLALDCGGKHSIYRHLADRGCIVHVVPHTWSAKEIRTFNPDGLFISNGPGDPQAVRETIATLRDVAQDFPTFGICLGHQLLALALGGRTFKLRFGHRGTNQPVRNLLTGQIEITSQNHGFCVDADSLSQADCEITHIHLNDGTLAGFRHRTRPIFSVQYHPEASPGPHDSGYLFDCFVSMMGTREPIDRATTARLQAAAMAAHCE